MGRQGGQLFGAGEGPAALGKGSNAHGARAAMEGHRCLPREKKKNPDTPGHQENEHGITPPHHDGSPRTPGIPGSLSHPRAPHNPALPLGPVCNPPSHVGGVHMPNHPSTYPSVLLLSILYLVAPSEPDPSGKFFRGRWWEHCLLTTTTHQLQLQVSVGRTDIGWQWRGWRARLG